MAHTTTDFIQTLFDRKESKTIADIEIRKKFDDIILLPALELDSLYNFLDSVLHAVPRDICSPSLPFILLQDALDILQANQCYLVYNYIEEHLNLWKKEPLYGAGKNYLLRMCNGLLKRLSPSQDTILCGRIQIFLAKLFPITDRSGLNLIGQFNVDNITHFETNAEFDEYKKSRSITSDISSNKSTDEQEIKNKIDNFELYQKFWSLQNTFREPMKCYEKDQWKTFTQSTEDILKIFEELKDFQEKANFIASPKRKSAKYGNHKLSNKSGSKIIEENFLISDKGHEKSIVTQSSPFDLYFAKFLTGSNLFQMQMEDVNFRRCILLQYLFTFQFLTTDAKVKTSTHVLAENQKIWIDAQQKRIYQLLDTGKVSKNFPSMSQNVAHFMKYEELWNEWKNSSCPPFTKISIDAEKIDSQPVIIPSLPKKKLETPKYVQNLGNPQMNLLWSYEPDNMKACASKNRIFKPALSTYLNQIQKKFDLSPELSKSMMEDGTNHSKQSLPDTVMWKALRLASHETGNFFYPYFLQNAPKKTTVADANKTTSATKESPTAFITDFLKKISQKVVDEQVGSNKRKSSNSSTGNIPKKVDCKPHIPKVKNKSSSLKTESTIKSNFDIETQKISEDTETIMEI